MDGKDGIGMKSDGLLAGMWRSDVEADDIGTFSNYSKSYSTLMILGFTTLWSNFLQVLWRNLSQSR